MPTQKLNLPTITGNMTPDVERDFNALANAVDNKAAVANGLATLGADGKVPANQLNLTSYATKNEVQAHINDYDYQNPSIVGTQIRLTKQSNTKRLFFKLNNNLSGNITISTDNGATNKNLVDTNGAQVTFLEKGFAEVVAEANFFILRNRGLSSSDMQALIAIVNEAEANESVLRTNYVDVVNETDESINLPSSATWNDILLQIPNINAGQKKYTVGTSQSTTDSLPFSKSATSGWMTSSEEYVEITNLSFVPSLILIMSKTNSIATLYYSNGLYNHAAVRVKATFLMNENSNFSDTSGALTVTKDRVILPVISGGHEYNWIAIE